MTQDLENYQFCIHLETSLNDQQRNALFESLENQTMGFWAPSSNQKSCCTNLLNFCVLVIFDGQ